MGSKNGPHPLAAGWSVLASRRLRPPRPQGSGKWQHDALRPVLDALREGGVEGLVSAGDELEAYRTSLLAADPDALSRDEALAYWLNLYNTGALAVAITAVRRGATSVFRVPGALATKSIIVAGERLSIEGVEHGKIRRFGDPRIHAALVCGALSCPTLRAEPYEGEKVDHQLDDQMRVFLGGGGAVVDRAAGALHLSRIFMWYGRDFTHPHRMPTLLPGRRRKVAAALTRWMADDDAGWVRHSRPRIGYQAYDFGLGCAVR